MSHGDFTRAGQPGNDMRQLVRLLAAFAFMVALIEAIRVAVAWWRGELAEPAVIDWLLLGALPLLGWIWWRYFSVFACREQCEPNPASRSETQRRP